MKWLAALGRSNVRHDFTGKILVVYSNTGGTGGILQDAKLVRIGFSHFVVGRRTELEPSLRERWSGVTTWWAIHDVAQLMIFDDLEAARRTFQSDQAEGMPSPPPP